MAWIYLAESEDSPSLWRLGPGQPHIVSSTPTPRLCCCHDKPPESCPSRLSGMMWQHSTEVSFLTRSISSGGDFRARTSVLREIAQALLAREAAFFTRLFDSPVRSDRRSFFSKTPPIRLAPGCPKSGERFARLAIGYRTLLLPLGNLGFRTSASDGLRLPTPQTREGHWHRDLIPTPVTREGGYNLGGGSGRKGKMRPTLGWLAKHGRIPTPMARDWKASGKKCGHGQHSPSLPDLAGAKLSPRFHVAVMGYPPTWTELNAVGIQWFRSKRAKRSGGSRASKAKS